MKINTQCVDGGTSLTVATIDDHLAVVQLLFEAGAEVTVHNPGPSCDFMEVKERVEGNASDVVF